MIFNEKILSVSSIHQTDETYRITTTLRIEDLCQNIKWAGLINPPILMEKATGPIIICGFRRIRACLELGIEEIKTRIVNPENQSVQCALLAVVDNISQRRLNLIEQSRALHLLAAFTKTSELQEIAASIGLPWQPSLVHKIKQLCFLPQSIQVLVISGDIGLKMALKLGTLPSEAGARMVQLFCDLQLGLNKQQEIYTLVTEIAQREDLSIEDVLTDDLFRKTLKNEKLDRPQKGRRIRDFLKKKRFPNLMKAESKFREDVTKLKLGNHMKLIPPADFEGSLYSLNLKFRNLAELEECRGTLDRILEAPELKDILER